MSTLNECAEHRVRHSVPVCVCVRGVHFFQRGPVYFKIGGACVYGGG